MAVVKFVLNILPLARACVFTGLRHVMYSIVTAPRKSLKPLGKTMSGERLHTDVFNVDSKGQIIDEEFFSTGSDDTGPAVRMQIISGILFKSFSNGYIL